MLSVNDYQILREIQSLLDQTDRHLAEINSQEKRIHSIQDLKKEKQMEKESSDTQVIAMNSKISDLELYSSKLEPKLELKKSQLMQVDNEATQILVQNEIQSLKLKIQNNENETLQAYEDFDQLNEVNSELIDFFNNIDTSINEITIESNHNIRKENAEISTIKERIELLFDELSSTVMDKSKRIHKKGLKPFISVINNQACSICGIGIPAQIFSQIQGLSKLETCSSCSRILIPSVTFS